MMSHLETTVESEFRVPGQTMPSKEPVFLGVPPEGPQSDLREQFQRFFANAKLSESGGICGPELIKRFIGDISRRSEAR